MSILHRLAASARPVGRHRGESIDELDVFCRGHSRHLQTCACRGAQSLRGVAEALHFEPRKGAAKTFAVPGGRGLVGRACRRSI